MSFSVPTSPAMSRSTKAQPVTPQRLPRQQPRSQSYYRSPLTPSASPYTPISLRSLDSTSSSTLTTPDNIGSGLKKRLAFSAGSPDVLRNISATQDKSLADIAENWRSRASENGIKVASASQDDSRYVVDESSDMSLSDVANDNSILSSEEALLAAPFLTTHRRLNSLPAITRPRAQSHASLPSSRMNPLSPVTSRINNRALPTSSPLQPRRTSAASVSFNQNLMSTPPPNRILARQLKLKGSLTDPAQPRRREAFGSGATPSRNLGHKNASMSLTLEPDTSLDLFDIDENDFETEHDYHDSEIENSFSRDLQALQNSNYGYPTFGLHQQQPQSQVFSQSHFADPFQPINNGNGMLKAHMLNGIPEGVEHQFHAVRQQQPQKQYYDDRHQSGHVFYNLLPHLQPQYNQGMPHTYSAPTFAPMPQPSLLSFQSSSIPAPSFSASSSPVSKVKSSALSPELSPTDCSVCLASNPASLAILQPCKHPLCSACLTSALNIVGEKDMECAVCKQSVADFKLVMGASKGDKSKSVEAHNSTSPASDKMNTPVEQSTLSGEPVISTFAASSDHSNIFDDECLEDIDELQSAFEFGLDFGELRASTPKLEQQGEEHTGPDNKSRSSAFQQSTRRDVRKSEDNMVLRIDNVPWDITPLQITKWLQQPIERVHVLLDGKGKTLSHAYVEVRDAATAGAILRGEAASSNASGKKERGSVLGRGRRARGVTVTRSGQQELMRDLFPYWRGGFDGSRPSLAGLEGDRIIGALEGGLLTEQEISGLLYLIREPDSHFLKVPSLPFHSLASILSKFPSDVDSRVFWSTGIRDVLLDATYTALQILIARVEKASEKQKATGQHEEEFTVDLVIDLLHTALDCKAFAAQQTRRLIEFAQAYSLPLPENDVSGFFEASASSSLNSSNFLKTPSAHETSNVVVAQQSLATDRSSLDDLAREFGVDAHVVQALAQRLAKMA